MLHLCRVHPLQSASFLMLVLAVHATFAAEQGYRLDRRSATYELPHQEAVDLTDEVTLEAWIKADPMGRAGGRILDKSVPGTSDGYMLDTYPGNSLRMVTQKGACSFDARLSADRWTHVAGVYSGSRQIMKLYIDGRPVASLSEGPFPLLTKTDVPLVIGADPKGENRFQGFVRYAAVYGRALSDAEILARANENSTTPTDGLIGGWRFPEEPGKRIASEIGDIALQRTGGLLSTEFTGELTGEAAPPTEPLSLWYRQPARQWVEALAVGNGRLGAMVFGGINNERLQLNEDTLWAGGPYDPANPEALPALPEARRLIFAGKYREANSLIQSKMMGTPPSQMPYQTIGSLLLSFDEPECVKDYRRDLSLDTAIAGVRFTADGVHYSREVFASPVDQVIVVRLTADQPSAISLDAAFHSPQRASTTTPDANTLLLEGTGGSAHGIPGALRFQTRLVATLDGGQVTPAEDHLQIRDADTVTLFIAAATSYVKYDDTDGDPEARTLATIAAAVKQPYEQLRAAHVAEHQRLFRRVQLDLGSSDANHLPTDRRIRQFAEGNDPQLAALYFQFGRYLLISSSRPGCQPANLQGIWNESMSPPWQSKYTININTEMNYWPAEPTNLGECVEPLVEMVRDLSQTGAHTAKVQWGADGWVCHHNTDLWRATAPIDGPIWGFWPTGGAWLTLHLWEHYEYHGDREYLEGIYPVLKGAVQFFLDTLVEEPEHGRLVTCPSLSPENQHPAGVSICAGPAMDQQILRDLFDAYAQAAAILECDPEFRQQVIATRQRLAPDRIGKAGQLQEWLQDWDMEAPSQHHRHVSHLYALFPSWQVNWHDTPELAKAAQRSLEIRGDNATGWGIGWRLNLWARLHDGEHAYKILTMLLHSERTYPNMFDAHPPFQIDGNFGGSSGIAEMLVQSRSLHNGQPGDPTSQYEVELLPALPAVWPSGSIRGLRTRGGFELDLTWEANQVKSLTVRSLLGNNLQLRVGNSIHKLDVPRSGEVRWSPW